MDFFVALMLLHLKENRSQPGQDQIGVPSTVTSSPLKPSYPMHAGPHGPLKARFPGPPPWALSHDAPIISSNESSINHFASNIFSHHDSSISLHPYTRNQLYPGAV
jgi:hypothetical protein